MIRSLQRRQWTVANNSSPREIKKENIKINSCSSNNKRNDENGSSNHGTTSWFSRGKGSTVNPSSEGNHTAGLQQSKQQRRKKKFCIHRVARFLLFGSILCWVHAAFIKSTQKNPANNSRYYFNQYPVNTGRMNHNIINDGEQHNKSCVPADWHSFHFVNCNEIHEIDLRIGFYTTMNSSIPVMHDIDRYNIHSNDNKSTSAFSNMLGHIAKGHWRDVWLVDPHRQPMAEQQHEQEYSASNETSKKYYTPSAVLKVFRAKRLYTDDSHQRHRRDALVMERLTSSKHVVDIYGFCGNTVLTEYAGESLASVIYNEGTKNTIESREERAAATRETPLGRLQLALQVSKGLRALHEIDGGPIIHGDIKAEQFLIDSRGNVKLNDFNMCRFMESYDNDSSQKTKRRKCKIASPAITNLHGQLHHSPEEYIEGRELDEKTDVYSLANVLHGILVGEKAWSDFLIEFNARKAITSGEIPIVKPSRTGSDHGLSKLIERAYALDPEHRPSASQLVSELEELITKRKKAEEDAMLMNE